MPLFSILIPMRNRTNLLKYAIPSILRQYVNRGHQRTGEG